VERKLASIWKEVLEAENEMGVYDDFTSSGGDSLRSLLVIAAIEQRFQLSVPPGFFGRFSTITRMAVQVTELLWKREHGADAAPEAGFRSSRIYKQLRDLTAAWDGSRASETRLIVSVGSSAAPCDLFLSLQTNAELQILHEHLGESVRLHGMRSGHLVMDYTPENVEALASQYVEELEALAPPGRLVLGGVCQGGIIAHAVASKLLERGRRIGPLVLIEQGRLLPFDGEIVSIFTENSFQNPTKRNRSGLAEYDRFYNGRCTVEFIPGEHASLFEQPSVLHLAAKLKAVTCSS
jgi:acyl carrier protein